MTILTSCFKSFPFEIVLFLLMYGSRASLGLCLHSPSHVRTPRTVLLGFQRRHHGTTVSESSREPAAANAPVGVYFTQKRAMLVHQGHNSGPESTWCHLGRGSWSHFVAMARCRVCVSCLCQGRVWNGISTISVLRPHLKTSATKSIG